MKFAAFIRGINVGGHNVIKMEDLKAIFLQLGYTDINTVIQSGNVSFESEETDLMTIRKKIEQALFHHFETPIAVKILPFTAVQSLAKDCPFESEKVEKGQHLAIIFLIDPPTKKAVENVMAHNSEADVVFAAHKNRLYAKYFVLQSESQWSGNFLEKMLNVPVTIRKLSVVEKLCV